MSTLSLKCVASLSCSVVFWFGDLNFRIEDYDIHVVKCAIDSNKLPLLWERDQVRRLHFNGCVCVWVSVSPAHPPPPPPPADGVTTSSSLQLNMAKITEPILEGFNEGQLNFPPTYKFDVGTHTYDTRWVLQSSS